MGYKNLYLEKIVLQEAVFLAVLGYIPGFALALGIYDLTETATLLPLGMQWERAGFVLFLTIVMCALSGFIALRKLRQADPADIF